MILRTASTLIVLVPLFLSLTGPAGAQSGLQVSPDQRRILVSKDVGAERWAISRDIADGSVSGNVFFPGGGSPRFVWCDQTGSSDDSVMLACSGSSRCLLAPCGTEAWLFVADVSLPLSFFEPRAGGAALACHATDQLSPQSTSPPSGLQTSPRGGVTLVSKDVGSERWAIARQESDGSVTGNVFYPDGSDPKFVWCRQTAHTGGSFVLSCEGADACGSVCSGSDWTFIAEVVLPESFFQARTRASIEELQARIDETLGDKDGFVALLLATDYGYSLEQVIHAIADGRLERSGLVRLRSGAIEEPDGPPLGQYVETPARPSAERSAPGRASSEKTSVKDVVDTIYDHPEVASALLFTVAFDCLAQGYTIEQFNTAVFTGRIAQRREYERWRWVLKDENGVEVKPAGQESPDVEEPELPSPTPTRAPTPTPTRAPTPTPAPTPRTCGNGRIDANEECDGANLAGATCVGLGFAGGTLRCTSRCTYDVTGCTDLPPPTPTPKPPVCEGSVCPDGICVPTGSDCCGNERYCPPGKVCVAGDKCCPSDTPVVCGNLCIPIDAVCCGGVGYCDAGEVCAGGNTACCPASFPQLCGEYCIAADATCCPDGGVCGAGLACTGVPGVCCAASFPQLCGSMCIPLGADCCGGGAGYCPPGSLCRSDGTCSGSDGSAFAASVSVVDPTFGAAEAVESRPLDPAP